MDGDKTSVFHDVDGSVSEYPGSYLIKEDNWLIRHPDCIDVPDWRGSICSGHFAQVNTMGSTDLESLGAESDGISNLCSSRAGLELRQFEAAPT